MIFKHINDNCTTGRRTVAKGQEQLVQQRISAMSMTLFSSNLIILFSSMIMTMIIDKRKASFLAHSHEKG